MKKIEIQKPLIFGDKKQIDAIKENERIDEYELIPFCKKCGGEGACGHCDAECIECDGLGKDFKKLEAFRLKYPNCVFHESF